MDDETKTDDQFSVSEAAELAGVAEATLRMWETRYHWPRPQRRASRPRFYDRQQIAEVKRVGELIANGYRIGEIILDGEPHWPTTLVAKPERPAYDFTTIPEPQSVEAQRLRRKLEDALNAQDQGTIAWVQAQTAMLRPRDRGPAVYDLLALAGLATTTPSPKSSTISQENIAMDTDTTQPTEPTEITTPVAVEPETLTAPVENDAPADADALDASISRSFDTAAGAFDTAAGSFDTAAGAFDLAAALRTKMTAEALSISAAAAAIDVSPVAVGNILSKGSRPNARTAARFAAWLGIDAALLANGPAAGGKKPGRKPAEKAEKKPKAEKAAKPAKKERQAEKADKAEKPAKPRAAKRAAAVLPTDEVLAIVRAAIEGAQTAKVEKAEKPASHPILKDALAQMIHEASPELRSAIKAMMNLAKGK